MIGAILALAGFWHMPAAQAGECCRRPPVCGPLCNRPLPTLVVVRCIGIDPWGHYAFMGSNHVIRWSYRQVVVGQRFFLLSGGGLKFL